MNLPFRRFPVIAPGRGLRAISCLLLTAAAASAQTVVVNEFQNAGTATAPTPGGDVVELLVTGSGTAGSTVDMRRMVLKDHSASMANDGGGKYRFNDIAFFSAMKAGTLIVITDATDSPDTDAADFVVRLGLRDAVYFTREAGTFDIAGTEMIMIKGQDASADGGTGAIHSLAGGAAGTQYNEAPGKKLLASGNSTIPNGVMANNSTSSLADYDGTDATGAVPGASLTFGTGNNTANNTFIGALRGAVSAEGAGLATVINITPASPFNGRNYFPRDATAQTVSVNLIANVAQITVSSVKVTVPAALGAPAEANVSVTGAGAGIPAITISGQEITITGVAVTSSNAIAVDIAGLSTPNPSAVTEDGRYPFTVQTAGDGGALTAIAAQPAAIVSIPVSSLRDVDANGVAADFGKVVAVEVVCTEEDFDSSLHTSAYGQDGDFGINIFIRDVELNLQRGKRYAILGKIDSFNSLTEISPASAADVIDLGQGVEPVPLTITIPDLLANPEVYEGRLIKMTALNYVEGDWASGKTVKVTDALTNAFDVRIQNGSAALTPPAWPATVTGIFGQYDDGNPGPGYQIMPRSDADVESLGGGTGYDAWAAAYPGIGGSTEDADGDSVSNLLEYAGGSIPNNAGSTPQSVQTLIGGNTLSVAWAKSAQAATDPKLAWSIEATTDLTAGPWTTDGVLNLVNGTASITADYIIQSGVPKVFLRLKVVRTP